MKTVRQFIIDLLKEDTYSAGDLSREIGVKEKEIYEHLIHISKSVVPKGNKLVIYPSECLKCGYIFKDRSRFTPPGRCPRCKESHITLPTYRIL